MKKHKIRNIIILTLTILCLAIIVYLYYPLKFAIKRDSINITSEYIVVTHAFATGVYWRIEPDEHGLVKERYYVEFIGNHPQQFCGDVYDHGVSNEFVCYGHIVRHGGDTIVFEATDWDIIYPIKTNELLPFLYPKSYLCRLNYNPRIIPMTISR